MRHELEYSPQDYRRTFQPEITYQHFELHPVEVATKSAEIIGGYLDGSPENLDDSYLANQSLSLVYDAKKGFLVNYIDIKGVQRIDPPMLLKLRQLSKPFMGRHSDEETETFMRMHLAFGFATDIATHPLLPDGYSRRGLLAPPGTTEEVFDRIDEMHKSLSSLIRINGYVQNGGKKPKFLSERPEMHRTFWTLFAMANMPLRNPGADKESISEFEKETWESLAEKFKNPQDR